MWHIKTNPLLLEDVPDIKPLSPHQPLHPVLCEVGGRTLKTTFTFATWLPVVFTKGMLERERKCKRRKKGYSFQLRVLLLSASPPAACSRVQNRPHYSRFLVTTA